jgi:antitoxin FitA
LTCCTSFNIIAITSFKGLPMATLLVRGVDEAIVRALKQRAGESGQSAEAEHRAILVEALVRPRKRSFAQVLAAMPNVGTDADFERLNGTVEAPRVFD